MDGQIDISVKRRRVNELLAIQHEITKQKDEEMIGQVLDCLIQEKGATLFAISESGKSIYLEDAEDLDKDKYYQVKITKLENGKVCGKILK